MNKLQQEIQKTGEQLKKLQEQLEATKTITIETAQPGDTLPDGCVVIERYEDSVLLAAPYITQIRCQWTPEFPEVFKKLKVHGFIPAQWHVPSLKELHLANRSLGKNGEKLFSPVRFWSSTEFSSTHAFNVDFNFIIATCPVKTDTCWVRAFRHVYL